MSTDAGITVSIDPVLQNINFTIQDALDSDSNINANDLNPAKHDSFQTSTDERITISINPLSRNAIFSIRDSLEPHST
jgi:hypothetical protein